MLLDVPLLFPLEFLNSIPLFSFGGSGPARRRVTRGEEAREVLGLLRIDELIVWFFFFLFIFKTQFLNGVNFFLNFMGILILSFIDPFFPCFQDAFAEANDLPIEVEGYVAHVNVFFPNSIPKPDGSTIGLPGCPALHLFYKFVEGDSP